MIYLLFSKTGKKNNCLTDVSDFQLAFLHQLEPLKCVLEFLP